MTPLQIEQARKRAELALEEHIDAAARAIGASGTPETARRVLPHLRALAVAILLCELERGRRAH